MEIFHTSLLSLITFIIKIILASLCGALVGLERQHEHKPAGARTLALVSLGSALFMIISLSLAENTIIDVSRIPAQIVTGVGFLGAGAIIRESGTVRGLTTAAGVWMVAAVGMAIGAGMYLEGLLATFLAYIILGALPKFLNK